jgi:fructokinase
MAAQAYQAPSILVIGEALVDCFPDARVVGGAPFNVARNLSAFGAAPIMITRIGDDHNGEMVLEECQRFKLLQVGFQFDKNLPTGRVDVLLSGTNHRFLIAENVAWDAIDSELAIKIARQAKPSIVCFGTLAQRSAKSHSAIKSVLDYAKSINALRLLDLNLRATATNADIAAWSLNHADIVKVNDEELVQLIQWFVPDLAADAEHWATVKQGQAMAALLKIFPLRTLIVTRGAQGYAAFDANGQCVAEGVSTPVTLVDSVGAGDAFTSVVVLGEGLGWALSKTLARASDFAATVCSVTGAVADNLQFYDRWLDQWHLAQR